jgi:signal transduction histidine kinase
MKFRNKILLAIWGIVLGLLVVVFVVINYWMRVQIQARFAEDLRSNCSAIKEISTLRMMQDVRTCQVIAETPRLKAVAEIGDENTALELSREINESVASDLFLLTDSKGNYLVRLIGGRPSDSPLPQAQPELLDGQVQTFTDMWNLNGSVFRVSSVAITVGKAAVGTITIGFRVLPEELKFVKSMTNSDVGLMVRNSLIMASFGGQEEQDLATSLESSPLPRLQEVGTSQVFTIEAPHERYAAIIYQLNQKTGEQPPLIAFLLLKPIERELKASLTPVLDTIMVLSVIVLIIAGVIGYIISRGISKPIAALVKGVTEISQGNYDYRIAFRTGGELKFLAQKLGEMSTSLRDKIHLVAERNVELEQALRQLKETEQELVKSERLAATGKLTAQIAHEINNPIHNIQSCLQTALKRLGPSGSDRELLEVAYEEVDRLSKLTRQMLDFYRSSMVEETRVRVNVNKLIEEVLQSSSSSFKEGDIEVSTKLDERLPEIEGWGDKLKQVFLNLFINAKDAMPNGGKLVVETSQQDAHVLVDVSDTGIGIPEGDINRIFDAFFTTKSKVSGVGLGLSVTYGIVKQHNGSIDVKSKVGEGTTFSLTFPVAKPHPSWQS